MIIQPFFFEWSYIDFFYDDEMVDKQFLIGKEIICIPILEVDSNFTIGYFPNEPFYDFTTGYINFGNLLFLYIPLNLSLPLYVRAGSRRTVVGSTRLAAGLARRSALLRTL